MKFNINKKYVKYSLIVLFLLIDSLLLLLIGENLYLFSMYIILNSALLISICCKSSVKFCITLSILMILFFTFFIDGYIHYLGKKVIIEAEFLFLLPLLIACVRSRKRTGFHFIFASLLYLLFNLIVLVLSQKVSILNYSQFIVNILSFIGFYYVFKCNDFMYEGIKLYKYIFTFCFFITLFQTAVGFSEDTRNGVFSVFGWGGYTFFIMIYFIYSYKRYLTKEIKLYNLIVSLLICCLLFICTESKAALVISFVSSVLITMVHKDFSIRKILIVSLLIAMIPIAYSMLLKFNPKFAYLNNIGSILNYYLGNNNWRYEFGRFEAIGNVFSTLDGPTKLFGVGFGASTPLYFVFFQELGRALINPYYIEKFGFYYGFQHTSTSTLILDGGLILFFIVILFLIKKVINAIDLIKRHPENYIGFLQFGILVYLVYYFTYANVLKDFRAMAIIGIILGMNYFNNDKLDAKKRSEVNHD